MEIAQSKDGSTTVLRISGRLDTNTAPELDAYLKANAAEGGLELDLSDLDYVSSAGLRVILALHKAMANKGGFRITHTKDAVLEVFEATGFTDVMDIQRGAPMDVSKLSPMGQYNMKLYSEGMVAYQQLLEMTKDPMRYNTELLMRILDENKDTEYGRRYGFAEIRTVEDFQRRVPVTVFDDYAGYIYEMTEDGRTDLITSRNVGHYAKSSGTMGNPKRIPVSDDAMVIMDKYNQQVRLAILCQALGFDWIEPPTINLIEAPMTRLRCGATYGAISGRAVLSLGEMLRFFMTSPQEALMPDPKTNTRYLHARFALADNRVALVACSYISLVLEMMQYIEKDWRLLVDDIERGTIDESIKMPDEVRASVLSKIQPMPERAAELRAIFEAGFDEPIMPRIWPNLRAFFGIATGGFADYLRRLREKYAGDGIRMMYVGVTASEGLFTTPYEMDNPDTVLVPDSVFYEFLPVDSDDLGDIVTMDKLEVGKVYEIIATNLSGFYRYRMRDALKVTGMLNNTPLMEFQYRIDQSLSVTGEKTTEVALRTALEMTEAELGFSVIDFSIYPDVESDPLRYVYLMEIDTMPEGLTRERIAEVLDSNLCRTNEMYGYKVEKGFLGRLEIRFVQPETYLLYRDLMISKGAASSQLKPPRIITSEVQRRFFLALLEDGQ